MNFLQSYNSIDDSFIVKWNGPEGEREGPLYVLWKLIESYQVDVFQVSLTKITKDFLNYIHNSNILQLESASSFLQIASKLLYYKSKALLPDPYFEEEKEEQDTLPKEIVQQLLEYRKFQKAADTLQQILEITDGIFIREHSDYTFSEYEETYNFNDLIQSYIRIIRRKILENQISKNTFEIELEMLSIESKMEYIKTIVEVKKQIDFYSLIEERIYSLLEIIVTFLAILELVKQKEIIVEQRYQFGSIFIFKRSVTVR